ncbi:MAG: hypothetical protein M1530_04425 [Candidatus Marsarchaeota archaeon]|nr:hypothetical protein [Candidatus Marsarchaeota archaeon]
MDPSQLAFYLPITLFVIIFLAFLILVQRLKHNPNSQFGRRIAGIEESPMYRTLAENSDWLAVIGFLLLFITLISIDKETPASLSFIRSLMVVGTVYYLGKKVGEKQHN